MLFRRRVPGSAHPFIETKLHPRSVRCMSSSARVVVIGAGMVGHELARLLAEAGQASVTLVGDEPHWPYDRIHLGRVIEGAPADELALAPVEGIERHLGDEAVAIDREARTVT